jgi:hypothetical protein
MVDIDDKAYQEWDPSKHVVHMDNLLQISETETVSVDELVKAYRRVAELEAQVLKWVAVGDGLPEKNKHVLVSVSGPMGDMVWIGVVTTADRLHVHSIPKDHEIHDGITHWMLMPPKP